MNNELKQQISEFLDNELASQASLELLQKAQKTPDIINTLNRYAAISQAIKKNGYCLIGSDFSAKIASRIAQEPAYLLPQRKHSGKHHKRILAAAASVAAVLVLASHDLDKPITSNATALQLAQKPTLESTEPLATDSDSDQQTPLNERIHDYLQAHNNSVYTNGEPDFKPMVKVTSYPNRQ